MTKVWNQGLHNNPRKKADYEHKFQYPLSLFVRGKGSVARYNVHVGACLCTLHNWNVRVDITPARGLSAKNRVRCKIVPCVYMYVLRKPVWKKLADIKSSVVKWLNRFNGFCCFHVCVFHCIFNMLSSVVGYYISLTEYMFGPWNNTLNSLNIIWFGNTISLKCWCHYTITLFQTNALGTNWTCGFMTQLK